MGSAVSKDDKIRVGVIGAGGRSISGYVRLFAEEEPRVAIVAMADPNEGNIAQCRKHGGSSVADDVRIYEDWKDLLEQDDGLDGLVITTPNHLHYEPTMMAIEKGIKSIALEKPMAVTKAECEGMVNAAKAAGTDIILGYTLRSAPFYMKIKEIVASKKIGHVVTIQADGLVSNSTSAMIFRGSWRRHRRYAGGSMLEKSCHDIDLLNWITGSRPTSVSSYGGQKIFTANQLFPEKCSECRHYDDCAYYQTPGDGKRVARTIDACIYNAGSDMTDYQGVQIQYENGAVCQFMMVFNTGRGNRHIRVIGTKGQVYGDSNGNVVYEVDSATGKTVEHKITTDGSGHGGSARIHIRRFIDSMHGKKQIDGPGPYEGYLSALICFAADQSMLEGGRQVHLRYTGSDLIELG